MSGAAAIEDLVSPAGVVSQVHDRPRGTLPAPLVSAVASVGSGIPGRAAHPNQNVICGGTTWNDPETARVVAIAEGAERYAGHDILNEERIWSSARDLAGTCLEPERYPRCSEREHAQPGCPVVRFDPSAPIRWVRGLDLVSRDDVWVPAVMACYGAADRVPAENFTYRISTGYAVHTDPVEAAVRGICEVIERDMIAVLWLQRLPLPVLDPATHPAEVTDLIEWCRRRFIAVHLLDATSDLGVPMVFGVLERHHDRRLCRVLGAGTGRSLGAAAVKALREALSICDVIRTDDPVPTDPARFSDVTDGSRYMGVPERAGAFDFLLTGSRRPAGPGREPSLPEDPDLALTRLTDTLSAAGMRPVIVDRTPRELADAGLTAINAVIPDLQPMSLRPLARFTGHPRLYEAPARMGYRVLTEKELNPWPLPFG